MREVGSVRFVYSTTLPEPRKGETDDLGYVTKRFVLVFYTLFPTHTLLGGGARWENGERVKEDRGLLGNPSHPWSGVCGAVLGQTGTDIFPVKSEIPHVRERFCQSTSPHCTPRSKLCLRSDAGYW